MPSGRLSEPRLSLTKRVKSPEQEEDSSGSGDFFLRNVSLSLGPCFAIFARRHTDDVAENGLEVVGVVVAALHGNVGDRHICCEEKCLCFIDTAADDVLHRRGTRDILEGMGEVIQIDVKRLSNIVQLDVFQIVGINIFLDAYSHVEGCIFFPRLFFRASSMEAIMNA